MQNDTKAAIYLFKGTNVNILDAVRILRGALDLKPTNCSDDNISYLMKVVNLGISAVRRGIKSKPIYQAYQAYLEEKSANLKPTSLRDIPIGYFARILPLRKGLLAIFLRKNGLKYLTASFRAQTNLTRRALCFMRYIPFA